ncbi:MAG: MaoC/PaaZ C-terminal domain-containing protein [Acidimicrobiales bacterium]
MYDPELLARHGFPTIAYDVIEVGERFRSDERLLRPEDVETYAFAVDDTDPWYVLEGPFGCPICHPSILANQALLLRHNRYVVPAGLHARMVYEFVAPIPLGVRALTVGRVVDKYVRRDKPYMVTEYETTDEAGAPLVRGRFVQMLFSRDTVPPAGSGPRPEPSPPADDPAIASVLGRGGRLQRGDRFGPVARTLQQRQLDAYSGVRPKSIHTDEGWARAKGFRTTIAQGMMSSAYVAALLTTAVGEGSWPAAGSTCGSCAPCTAGTRSPPRPRWRGSTPSRTMPGAGCGPRSRWPPTTNSASRPWPVRAPASASADPGRRPAEDGHVPDGTANAVRRPPAARRLPPCPGLIGMPTRS